MSDCKLTKVDNGYIVELSSMRIHPRKRFVAKTLETVFHLVMQWDATPEPAEEPDTGEDDMVECSDS